MGSSTIERADLKPAGGASRLLGSSWAILTVVAAAVVLRAWDASEWSLWEDEETSIYFSQQLGKTFPRFFPLFFLALHGVYQFTGVSVAAGRMLAAAFGIASIGLIYAMARRLLSREIALLAALLLTLNLGHLFWSQSIRYFTLLFFLELLSMHWFLEGFERRKIGLLLLSNLAFALALWTHFSALLLMPVYVAYLLFTIWGRQSGGAYNVRGYLTFGVAHCVILGLMALQFVRFHGVLKGMADPTMQNPVRLSILAAAYFGVPVIALACLSPFVAVNVPGRVVLFFLLAGVLPVLELIVIAGLHLSNVTWYYGFVAMGGFTVAAAVSLVSLYRRGCRWPAKLGAAAVLVYALPLLAGYYTTMHGDRPRWKDACRYLSQEEKVRVGIGEKAQVFATVPGVVAFYLGVPPGETMGSPLVQPAPARPPSPPHEVDQWYVVESGHTTPQLESWLQSSCTLRATFPAWTGPRDRSIHVYFCAARRAEHAPAGREGSTGGRN